MKAIKGPFMAKFAFAGCLPERMIASTLPFLRIKDVIRQEVFIENYKINRQNSIQLLNEEFIRVEYERVKAIEAAAAQRAQDAALRKSQKETKGAEAVSA